jgi:hypothetical protein
MAPPRRIFRIEETIAARREPDGTRSALADEIMEELGALRAAIATAAAGVTAPAMSDPVPSPNGDLRRLVSELRAVRVALGADAADIAGELQAVIRGSEQATQKMLAAAEDIDIAAHNLSTVLKDDYQQGLAQDTRDRVIQIFEACNFQDLTGQRVVKAVAQLAALEVRVGRIADALARLDGAPTAHGPRLPGESGHVSQSDIDAMFEADIYSA